MSNTALSIVDKARNAIAPIEQNFTAVEGLKLSFQKEMGFAIQLLSNPKNQYLAGLAIANPQDLQTAIYNVALTGLSLNPVLKHGYLQPRGGRVIFEPSYMGLTEVLIQAGTVTQIWAYLVYENDFIQIQYGANPDIKHTTDIKQPLGNIVGVYAIAVLPNRERQFEVMTYDEVMRIKARSESVKAGKDSPWNTDIEEMIRKTVIRRIFKRLPKTNLSEAALNALQLFDDNNPIDYDSPIPPSENDPAVNIRAARLNEGSNKQLPAVNPTVEPAQQAVIAPEANPPAEPPPIDEKERKLREAIDKGEQLIANLVTLDEINTKQKSIDSLSNPFLKEALSSALLDRATSLGFEFKEEFEVFALVEETTDEPIEEAPMPEPPPAMVQPEHNVNIPAVMAAHTESKTSSNFAF